MAYDPKLDPNNSEYDATLDPNSDCYDEAAANEYKAQNPDATGSEPAPEAAAPVPADEQQSPALPGSTPQTSEQLRKAKEGEGSGGKSPLIFDPNAPAVDSVSRQRDMLIDGEVDEERTPQQQLMSAVRGGKQGSWQNYAPMAIRSLYPHLRDGVDYLWGRRDADSEPEMIYWNDRLFPAADMGEIEKISTKLMERDPAGMPPKPGLHTGSVLGEGEVPKGERAQDQPIPPDLGVEKRYNPPPV